MMNTTPINQNRIDLFGNTTATSLNLFGSITILQPSLFETTTLHKTESMTGLDKLNRNDIQTTSNVCKFHLEDTKDHPKLPFKNSTSSSFLFDTKSSTSTAMTFTFGENQPSTSIALRKLPTTKPAITPSTTTLPTLFSTMNQPKASPLDLQLFQTMANIQPFNNQLAFLARNIKPNVNINRSHSKTNLYSTTIPKPTKRKFNESILDDDDDNALFSKINIKRPRMLDMNKIRSIVLGNNDKYLVKTSTKKFDQRAFCLPRLTHHDYYTEPAIEELQTCFNEQGQCFVKQFTITRKHYGSVTFQGSHMNLSGLDLNRLVEIDRRQVTVYPDEKDRPNEGEELNCQAIISLIGVYPIDRSISNGGEEVTDPNRLIEMNYGKYLEGMTKKFQGHFLDYDVYTGTWTFQVEHF